MSLLGDLTAYVDSLKRTAGNSLRDLRDDPQGLLSMRAAQLAESLPALPQSVMPGVDSAGLGPMRPTAQDWSMGAAMNAPTMGLLGHTVYHGSPYKFDKFDSSKIGAGEGAQAYGHGLYLAENRGVADSYRANLSDTVFSFGGRDLRGPSQKYGVPAEVQAAMRADQSMPEKMATYALDSAVRAGSNNPAADAAKHISRYGKGNPDAQAALEVIRQWEAQGAKFEKGNLYKVDLPDEWLPKMLDWDKPLSQQTPEVRKILETEAAKMAAQRSAEARASFNAKLAAKGLPPRFLEKAPDADVSGWTGQQFHSAIENSLGGKIGVSEYLRAQGIPGIRYLDQGSRAAGNGTRNYVVFPGMEHLLKILSRE